jgi:hypothetical protein
MIRPHNALRPDAACHSADVLTPPERYASQRDRPEARAPAHQTRTPGMCWGDHPELNRILTIARGRL